MSYTTAQINKLRRLTAEPSTSEVYTNTVLEEVLDEFDGDLYAAAAEIWDEKAAAVSGNYDFEADGGKFSRSQMAAQYTENANKYRAMAGFDIDPEEIIGDDESI